MKYFLSIFAFLIFANITAQNFDLSIKINDIPSKYLGKDMYIAVWSPSDNFLEEDNIDKAEIKKVSVKDFTITLSLPKGTYAFSVYIDANGNKKLDKNMFGAPKEPFGFSNSFKPKLSAPKFNQCSFDLNKNTTQTIELIY